MRNNYLKVIFILLIIIKINLSASPYLYNNEIVAQTDSVSHIINLLNELAEGSENSLFKNHCASIINLINSTNITSYEEKLLESFYANLSDSNAIWSTGKITSYIERRRPFIISWQSPTDGTTSLAWLLRRKIGTQKNLILFMCSFMGIIQLIKIQ